MENLYQRAKRGISTIALAGLVGLVGCEPEIEKVSDINRDSILDVQLYTPGGFQKGRRIYLGNKDGSYTRLYQEGNEFKTNDEVTYFIDAESGTLRLSQKIEEKTQRGSQ